MAQGRVGIHPINYRDLRTCHYHIMLVARVDVFFGSQTCYEGHDAGEE